jgi:hypothetical protein
VTRFPNEAWCPRCSVTHVPGTARCIHCGGPVMPERPPEGVTSAAQTGLPGSLSPWQKAPPEEPEAGTRTARPLRFGMAALWIVLAIVTAILRACREHG